MVDWLMHVKASILPTASFIMLAVTAAILLNGHWLFDGLMAGIGASVFINDAESSIRSMWWQLPVGFHKQLIALLFSLLTILALSGDLLGRKNEDLNRSKS